MILAPPSPTSRSLLPSYPPKLHILSLKLNLKNANQTTVRKKNTITKLNTNTQNHEVHFHIGIIIMKIFVVKFEDDLSK